MSEIVLDYAQSTQAKKEITINALIRAMQQGAYFGIRESMTGLLNFGIYGGIVKKLNGTLLPVDPIQFTIAPNSTTCISIDGETGDFIQNINTFGDGIKLYVLISNSTTITEIRKYFGAAQDIDLLSNSVQADWDATSGPQQILNKPTNLLDNTNIIAGDNITLDISGNDITINSTATGTTLEPASDTVLGGVKIPLDSNIKINSSNEIYSVIQEEVIDPGSGDVFLPNTKGVIWKIDNSTPRNVYLPLSTTSEEGLIIKIHFTGSEVSTIRADAGISTDVIDSYRNTPTQVLTTFGIKGFNYGLYSFILHDKINGIWKCLNENTSTNILGVSSNVFVMDFSSNFDVVETSDGSVTIDVLSQPITVKDEGTALSTNISSIDFTGTGVTTTNTGSNITVNIPGSDAQAIVIKDEGTNITTNVSSIDFTGDGISATNTGSNVTVTVNKNKLTVKDEGTNLSTDSTSIDFTGAGVTATNTGGNITVNIPGTTAQPITVKDEGSNLSTNISSIDFTGSGVTATNTGSNITVNIPGSTASPITVKDEGTTLTTSLSSLDFTGSGITATNTGGNVTINVPGTTAQPITVKDEGTNLSTNISSIDFVGAGVTATNTGSNITVTIPGGSSGTSVAIQDEGTTLTTAVTNINFIGDNITATNSGSNVTITATNGYTEIVSGSNITINAGVNTVYTRLSTFDVSLLANTLYEIEFQGVLLTSASNIGFGLNYFCTDTNAFVSGTFMTLGVSSVANIYTIPTQYNSTNPLKVDLNGNSELIISGTTTRSVGNPVPAILKGFIKPTTNCTFYIKGRTSDTATTPTASATLYSGSRLLIKKV